MRPWLQIRSAVGSGPTLKAPRQATYASPLIVGARGPIAQGQWGGTTDASRERSGHAAQYGDLPFPQGY